MDLRQPIGLTAGWWAAFIKDRPAFRGRTVPRTTHSRVPNANEKSADFCEICIVFRSRFLRCQIFGTFYLHFCGVLYRPHGESAPKNSTELGFSYTFRAQVWHSPRNRNRPSVAAFGTGKKKKKTRPRSTAFQKNLRHGRDTRVYLAVSKKATEKGEMP